MNIALLLSTFQIIITVSGGLHLHPWKVCLHGTTTNL
jgi:hypothetical protein